MASCSSFDHASNVSCVADEHLARASESLARACWADLGSGATFAEREARLHTLANEAVRKQLELELQRIEDAHGGELLVGGKRHRRHQLGQVAYHTLVGDVHVRRWTYREVGVRNGATVVPLDLVAGMIHRASPSLAFSVAHGYSAGPTRHYEALMKAAHRNLPSHATVERLARAIGECAAASVIGIEAEVRATESVPVNAHAVVVSLDRTSVAMAETRPRGSAPNSPRRARTKPHQRRPPRPYDVNWRMIYVGTASVVDEAGEVIVTRKYHATPDEKTEQIMERMMADVVHWRSTRTLPVAVVQDGAPEMWNVVRPALQSIGIEKWTEILDRFHVTERLASALEILERDENIRRRQLEKWKRQIDRSDAAIPRITRWLEKQWAHVARGRTLDAFGNHVGYLAGYAHMMKYVACRRAGLPIGSGVVEGACKSLVAARAKRSGQRWKPEGLTGALTLRGLDQSQRLTPFWLLFSQRFSADIRAA